MTLGAALGEWWPGVADLARDPGAEPARAAWLLSVRISGVQPLDTPNVGDFLRDSYSDTDD